jgi:hypothetical protein
VAEPGSDDVHRDPRKKKCGGVRVAQIAKASMRSDLAGGTTDLLYALISLLISALTVSG